MGWRPRETTAVDTFVSGAQAYAQSTYGLSVPASAVPLLRSYVVTQLQAVAASGLEEAQQRFNERG